MAKRPANRQKVSFISRRKISVPHKVAFKTKRGKKVSFRASKTISKPVRVTFYARTRKKGD